MRPRGTGAAEMQLSTRGIAPTAAPPSKATRTAAVCGLTARLIASTPPEASSKRPAPETQSTDTLSSSSLRPQAPSRCSCYRSRCGPVGVDDVHRRPEVLVDAAQFVRSDGSGRDLRRTDRVGAQIRGPQAFVDHLGVVDRVGRQLDAGDSGLAHSRKMRADWSPRGQWGRGPAAPLLCWFRSADDHQTEGSIGRISRRVVGVDEHPLDIARRVGNVDHPVGSIACS